MTRNELLRYIFWEWIEPIGSALGIALLVMKFVMALYVIPTGSMQPTLHGKGDYPSELGDKVLVNKFIYRFEKPKRWDVIVFEFPYRTIVCNNCQQDVVREVPNDAPNEIPERAECFQMSCRGKSKNLSFIRKDYIKRCVAVPGDEVSVRDGSIVLKEDGVWKHSVKTDLAQDAMWVPVFDSEKEEQMGMLNYYWKSNADLSKWQSSSVLELSGETEQSLLFYDKENLRGHGDKGPNGGPLPLRPFVGDVQLSLELNQVPAKGKLDLEISWNHVPHILELDFTAKTLNIKLPDQSILNTTLPKFSELSFARVDGHIWLELDDVIQKFPIKGLNPSEITKTIMPKLRYKGEKLRIDRLEVKRDIFYQGGNYEHFTGQDQSYKVMSGSYFAMGDNSYHSYDGRMWGPVPEEQLIGKALTVILPFSRIKLIY